MLPLSGEPPKGGIAQTSGGYTHIVDFTDPMNPRKVGRYHLEDYGSHDIIVEKDILYQAYYDGGARVVDVSGMLLGNLYDRAARSRCSSRTIRKATRRTRRS